MQNDSKNINKTKEFLLKYSSVIINSLYFLCFISAILLKIYYFQFSTGLNINDDYNHDANIKMLHAAFYIILMIISVVYVAFNKRKMGALFVVNAFLSFILLADTLYYRYYQLPISISIIYQLDFVKSIKSTTASLFVMKDWLYFIDLPVFLIFSLFKYKLPKFTIKRRYTTIIGVIVFIVSYSMFNNVYATFNTALYGFDRNYAAKDLSVLYFHKYDIKNFLSDELERSIPLTSKEKDIVSDYFKSKWAVDKSNRKYKGVAEGRNLIVVQVEAFQHFVVEKEINGQEITPFLNNLINNETVYMNNIYHQVAGGNTSDAEFMMNNSLYPIGSGAVYFRYANNTYKSLPKTMKEKGYNTFVLHSYKPSFWNRQNMYNTLGFDKFFSINDFKQDDIIGWAASDDSMFKQSINKIKDKQPFYSFYVTLSSHHPYEAFAGFDNIDVGKYKDTQLGHFIKAARYDDHALEQFFKYLKEAGLYDNSIIVIYGDHSALFEDQKDDLCEFMDIEYNPYNWQKLQQIPLFIHIPNSNICERIETTGGDVDILPTIANLMNIDMPYMMGKDLINTPYGEGYSVLRYSSVMTDNYMYVSRPEPTVYDMKTGEELNVDDYKDDIKEKSKDLTVSDIIINKDYFGKIDK